MRVMIVLYSIIVKLLTLVFIVSFGGLRDGAIECANINVRVLLLEVEGWPKAHGLDSAATLIHTLSF